MSKQLVICKNDRPLATSKQVAETFEKEHKHVLESIRNIIEKVTGKFSATNYLLSHYKSRGKEYPMYLMTKDGFTMLVMGYTDELSMQLKELYIKKFNEMERFITSKQLAKIDFPQLTDNIKMIHEVPKPYHYSNELNMINKIVLGKNAKQYREENGIEKKTSIRPFLNTNEIELIEKLQRVDVGMVIAIPDFYDRKKTLQNYFHMIKKQKLI